MFKKIIWYLFLFLLPWQTRWIFFSGHNEYSTYSLLALDLILLLLLFLYRQDWSSFLWQSWQRKSGWLHALILFDLSVFLSIFWAGDQMLAIYKYSHILGGELLFLLAVAIFKKDFYYSAYFFLFGALAQSILAMIQFARQQVKASTILGIANHDPYVLGTSVLDIGPRILRVYGSFGHPNTLGGFLAVALVVLFYIWLKRDKQPYFTKNKRLFTLFFISIFSFILTALLLSFSRAALLSLVVALIFLSFKLYQKIWPPEKDLRSFLVLILLIFIPVWLTIGWLYAHRLDGSNRLESISVTERLSGLETAQEIILSSRNGVGLGNYTKFLELNNPGQPGFVYQPVHNGFILLVAESGFWTLILLLIFVGLLFKKKKTLLGALSLGFLVLLSFDHWLFSLPWGFNFFFLCLALGYSVAFLQED